jgi:DNA-binding winged helix-turn-helix (wHTH) protein/tetratricopeptide (TPR) repeat protein
MNNLEFGEFTLDTTHRQVRRDDLVLPIAGKAFDLLQYMAANAGRPLLKDELLKAVWPDSIVEEANLTQNVSVLRKALGSSPKGPIVTLPGRGYQFAAKVTELATARDRQRDVALPYPVPSIASLTMEATQTRMVVQHDVEEHIVWLKTTRVVALVLLLAIGAGGWFARQRWLDRTGGAPMQVVLLPAEGTTGDAILDKSLTQALRMDLAQSPYVSVIPEPTVQATLSQMMHEPGDPVIPAIAREVCERTNSQGVVSGNIAKVGQHFLITEEASNCVDGSVVAEAKYEAEKPEDLPHGIDKIAANLRQKLGESRRSIARFDTPLIPGNTASLEALKEYTQATSLASQGQFADAITLLKSAVQLDPGFAAARYSLAVYYLSTNDFVNGRIAIAKAYEVRATATEPVRLAITAFYDKYSTQDLFAAEGNFRSWTELYPRSVQAWNGLYIVQRDLGHHADSAVSSRKALTLLATNQTLYEDAASAQLTSGDIQGSRATLDNAIAHNLDGDRIRGSYLYIAVLLHDSELLRTQQAWINGHPEASFCRMVQTYMAIEEGRFDDAHRLLEQVTGLFHQQGLSGLADDFTKSVGADLVEAGDREAGIRIFRSVPLDPEDGDDLAALAQIGDLKTAAADLEAMRSNYPHGTLSRNYFGPIVEANIALANHDPRQAISIMEATRPVDDRSLSTRKFRGDLYLSTGQPSLAEKEYRAVLAHREVETDSVDYALACLGLGRALTAKGNRSDAIDAYQHFLSLWAHADPDAAYLKQARLELARLQTQ